MKTDENGYRDPARRLKTDENGYKDPARMLKHASEAITAYQVIKDLATEKQGKCLAKAHGLLNIAHTFTSENST